MNFVAPISSEIFLAVSAMLLLLAGAYSKEKGDAFVYKTSMLVVLLTIYLLIQKFTPVVALNGMFINDEFALFMKVTVLGAVFCVLFMAAESYQKGAKNPLPFEFPVLVMLSAVGMMVMISANNLMSLYMGLELQSLALYVLTAMRRDSIKSTEAGLKYFMLGALSSGILLYGSSLIYGFLGTLQFQEIATLLGSDSHVSIGVIFGMVLVFVGLCFKISAVPFHMWAPDVYEGAPKIITSFFASAPKVAAVALFVRVAIGPFGNITDQWQQIIICVSIGSMVVGAFGALVQTNIKRLLAYSSIGHMGFAMVGLAAGTVEGIQGVLVYTVLYVTMSLGVFAFVLLMKRRGDDVEKISDLAGMGKDRPLFALGLTALMFSMAGIPPLAGFFGKFYVFKAAMAQELYALSIIGVLSSVVSAYYYIKIIKVMYFDKAREALDTNVGLEMKLVLTILVGFNILYLTFPSSLLNAAKTAAESLF
jgi:NADH-quinone oxidoreductase subunit N